MGGPCPADVEAVGGSDGGHGEHEEVGGDGAEGVDELTEAHATSRLVASGGCGALKPTEEDPRRVVACH